MINSAGYVVKFIIMPQNLLEWYAYVKNNVD